MSWKPFYDKFAAMQQNYESKPRRRRRASMLDEVEGRWVWLLVVLWCLLPNVDDDMVLEVRA